jgi:phosphoenolpyruvate-protein kinase (PTS system EI component)
MLEVKDAIRRTHLGEARQLARMALDLGSAAEVEALLNEHRPMRKYDSSLTSGSTTLLDF